MAFLDTFYLSPLELDLKLCWWKYGFLQILQQIFYCAKGTQSALKCSSTLGRKEQLITNKLASWNRLLKLEMRFFCIIIYSLNIDIKLSRGDG